MLSNDRKEEEGAPLDKYLPDALSGLIYCLFPKAANGLFIGLFLFFHGFAQFRNKECCKSANF